MKEMMMKRFALIILVAFATSAGSFAQSPIVGDWQGTLDAGGSTFHVAWHVTAGPDGSLTSTLDNIDQNIYGIKAKSTTVKGFEITVIVDDMIQANGQEINLQGELVGTLNKDATELNGTWTQMEPPQPPVPLVMKHAPTQPAEAGPAAASATTKP